MSTNEYEIDLEKELSAIPAAYQDVFRQAMGQELVDADKNRTDGDILAYLRQRRESFKSGSFIRPDGRPGMVTMSAEAMYEQALPQLAQGSMDEPDETAERRQLFIKVGLFALLITVGFFFLFRGRSQEQTAADAEAAAMATEEAAATVMTAQVGGVGNEAVPTPPLPTISGVDDSLQTIGGLGGALTIGRPSSLELTYRRTEETIALAIDPSQSTPKGELRYNEATMVSDNPVAVWLFGTVLNYAIGIPDSLVRNLETGDRIVLNTDTGASLRFVVTETRTGTNYESGSVLSQSRMGLTLFSLPATDEDKVTFAFANYDIGSEADAVQVVHEIGESFVVGGNNHSTNSQPASGQSTNGHSTNGQPATGHSATGQPDTLQVTAVQFSNTADGALQVTLTGNSSGDNAASNSAMLSLTSNGGQTTAMPLVAGEDGAWQAVFTLPAADTGAVLFAEYRRLSASTDSGLASDGGVNVIHLGDIPDLIDQLEITASILTAETVAAERDASGNTAAAVNTTTHAVDSQEQLTAMIVIHNPTEGAIYLDADFIQYPPKGGDADVKIGQTIPRLPTRIEAGETMEITVLFHPYVSEVLQIGNGLWER